ncbi:MAG: hypothetical protein M4579_006483 [Chaenotheca gracillima]|nr:MAG: hypothetical protein M4579_006483 [Chaenotheca gracillima]
MSRSRISVPTIEPHDGPRRLRVLAIATRLDSVPFTVVPQLEQWCERHSLSLEFRSEVEESPSEPSINHLGPPDVNEMSRWADMLILATCSARRLAEMLQGMTGSPMLDLVRGWDVSKKILLIPAMTNAMWENPMTKRQLHKIRRKWNWIRVMQPLLWEPHLHGGQTIRSMTWNGYEELIDAVKNQADLMAIGQDVDTTMGSSKSYSFSRDAQKSSTSLPPEIWSLVMEHLGDWEVAKALGIFTNLQTPFEWQHVVQEPPEGRTLMQDLEWTLLTSSSRAFINNLEAHPTPQWLSPLIVKIIIKFQATNLLSYLETRHKDLFWATFGHSLLPTKASAFFGKISVLEWWRTSPSFLIKEYNHEAIDGASRAGFVHVLDWWLKSGLPLRYTEAALEQASSKGHIEVLDWWKNVSLHHGVAHADVDMASIKCTSSTFSLPSPTLHNSFTLPNHSTDGSLRLLVGRSICFAALNNRVNAVRWWDSSGIPYSHEDAVAKIASTSGAVDVLRLWKELKGEKMIFDNQVLAGPTKGGHREVLEWWKRSGFKVEYRPCDIEEALEDSLNREGEERVKVWWARNGLNLGVGTSEWMTVKTL